MKMVMHNRSVAMKLDTDKWTSVLESGLSKYNLSQHKNTEMKPTDGKKEANRLLIWWNLHNKAKKERMYK